MNEPAALRIARFVSLGSWRGELSDAIVAKRAILNYAVYRTVVARHHDPSMTAVAAREALPQFAPEAVRYHLRSRGCLRHWPGASADHRGPVEIQADEWAQTDAADELAEADEADE